MDRGLSQRKFAKMFGVNKASLENWEGNKTEPARWILPRLERVLDGEILDPARSAAEALAAYRKGAGLSRRRLADRLGVHVTVLLRWEKGERLPRRSSVERIRAFLGTVTSGP